MGASNRETIYSAGSGDWTSARTVPMSHGDNIRPYV